MWLIGLCASNQALDASPVNLSVEGEVLRQRISIPMNERYELALTFRFESREAFERSAIAGKPSGANLAACTDGSDYASLPSGIKEQLGADIELQVTVSSATGKPEREAQFRSRCLRSWGDLTKTRHLGYLELSKGEHELLVVNRKQLAAEPGALATLVLVGAGAGFK